MHKGLYIKTAEKQIHIVRVSLSLCKEPRAKFLLGGCEGAVLPWERVVWGEQRRQKCSEKPLRYRVKRETHKKCGCRTAHFWQLTCCTQVPCAAVNLLHLSPMYSYVETCFRHKHRQIGIEITCCRSCTSTMPHSVDAMRQWVNQVKMFLFWCELRHRTRVLCERKLKGMRVCFWYTNSLVHIPNCLGPFPLKWCLLHT